MSEIGFPDREKSVCVCVACMFVCIKMDVHK